MHNHVNAFKTKEAYNAFTNEALALENNLSRAIHHNHCETLHLFVNEDTGHIITWYRQHDPAATILDAQYYNLYQKILWQIRGTA